YGLLRYMFHDRYLTKDELFAAGAVFTLLAWGFAFLYSVWQLWVPYSFSDTDLQALLLGLDLIFLSLSFQSYMNLYASNPDRLPYSFSDPDLQAHQPWLDLIFLSFSVQSATGLSDVMPVSPLARMLAIIQMFVGVMYLALIVSRLIALHYISHLPKQNSAENQHRSPDE